MKYLMSIKSFAGILAIGIFLMLSACAEKEEPPIVPSTPILTDPDLPQELLTEIFTPDIPEKIRNVDEFLNNIERNGMKIYRGPIQIQLPFDAYSFAFKNLCIYDERNKNNVGFEYGSYFETIRVVWNQDKGLRVETEYYSKGNVRFPDYPDRTDYGSGNGIIIGNGNNEYSIFLRIEGNFQEVSYNAIWIISYSVEINQFLELKNVTKCLVMVNKGPDPEGKVASIGAVRIFRDEMPERAG